MKNVQFVKYFLILFTLGTAITLAAVIHSYTKLTVVTEKDEAMVEDISGLREWMQKMLADPSTGNIPQNFRANELVFSRNLPAQNFFSKAFGGAYVPRGPWNVGGRTRAIAIDKTNENILLAGSTMGGFWRSTNAGQNWLRCKDSSLANNITCIVQDTRNNKTNIWYAGTGELYGSSLPGAFFSGNGVYKSTDNGLSWKQLNTTITSPGGLANAWSAVNSIVVNTTIDSIDVVYAATFDGIYRSINGGTTFIRKLGGGAKYSLWSDLAISKTGIVYATLSGDGTYGGIYRSGDNGNSWTNITPSFFTGKTMRVVIGIAPSDETQIYFAAFAVDTGKISYNFEKTPERNCLWKYTYLSGNGSGSGGKWEDRSANIPTLGGAFGDFISQQGYCLSIKVRPDNANVVFLGGTNLYRSTDGFSTSDNSTWIGGYGVNTSLPGFKVYPNHHPDNHGVIFYPSNSSKMISVHDGGISSTNDNMASNVVWNTLNTGYLNTQFYTVAIDRANNSEVVVGGLQDNGTYFTNNSDVTATWTQPLSADGSFCFLSPGSNETYMSTQQGKIYRITLDANGNGTQYARIDPKGIDKNAYEFINPFTPDAHNWKKVFVPAGNRIWRNNDVSVIPFHPKIDSTPVLTGWTEMTSTINTDSISAILSSTLQNDVIYYATEHGKIYRLNNASSDTSVPQNISGNNFPTKYNYINCIAQHPKDSNKIFVVFTNYGVLSVFYTSNGGANWTPVSGNLEQYPDGTGIGPSCRWLTIANVHDSMVYYVGTSTGLYATRVLNGTSTIWTNQSPDAISNNIVMMMDYRESDGMMAVATFGAGIFSSKIQSINQAVNETRFINRKLITYPNPAKDLIQIQYPLEFSQTEFTISDIRGAVAIHRKLYSKDIEISDLKPGIYFITINAGETIYTGKFLKE